MDLSLTEEHEALRHSVRSLLEDRFPTAAVRECEADPDQAQALYRDLFELGLGGILVDEASGGLSLGFTEMVVTQAELGRALVPALFAETAVFAARALASTKDPAAQALLARIADGEVLVSCAWQDVADGAACTLSEQSGTTSLSGVAGFVSEAAQASHLLVAAIDGAGQPALCIVDTSAHGIALTDLPNLADQSIAHVRFDAAPVLATAAHGEAAREALRDGLAAMEVAIAAQAAGGAERVLEITREYASTRKQFGQPIGAFQAIAHMLADCAVNFEGARMLAYRAASAADEGEPWHTWADLAKLKACQAYRDISATAIQVHGGIGFTLEADPQLFYRRAKHLQLMFGAPLDLQERAGEALIAGEHKVLEA